MTPLSRVIASLTLDELNEKPNLSNEHQYFPEASAILRNAIDSHLKGQGCVLGHRRPDGDCIGSQVALSRVLLQNGLMLLL